ncbi:MAG TPA: cobalamin biosynthesis protein CbiX [Oceanospirillaceae bacterium]|nr:cobalamin biosynthesis protein CbiX [Oceanospirillaceae bacterium]
MTHLLIVAHGSKSNLANRTVQQLAKKVALHLPVSVDKVSVGFLEFSQPSIQSLIENSFLECTQNLLILPYFLSNGMHVTKDIPNIIQTAERKWPSMRITLLPHIGAMEEMSNLIAKRCVETLIINHELAPVKTMPKHYELEMNG